MIAKKKKNFNILEIILLKKEEELAHVGFLRKSKIKVFTCKKEEFLVNFDKILKKMNVKKINIFCIEPAILLSTILSSGVSKDVLKLTLTAARLEIYGFEFYTAGTFIRIQNINKLITEDTILQISPEFKFTPIINYISRERELRYTLPEWAKDWETFRLIENLKKKNIYESTLNDTGGFGKLEIMKIINNNLKAIKRTLTVLDLNLSMYLENWNFHLSISSTSLEIFIKFFNKYRVSFDNNEGASEILREALFGGRCEIFGNPYYMQEDVFHFDFPSMYLNIMKENLFPTGSMEHSLAPTSIKNTGFYRCRVFSDLKIPILPTRLNQKNATEWEGFSEPNIDSVLYPNGEFLGIYFSAELDLFIEHGGRILELLESWTFVNPQKPVFKDFAENILDMRELGNSKIWKSIGVSLYGRLGMKRNKTTTVITDNKNYALDTCERTIISERWVGTFCFAEVVGDQNKTFKANITYAIIIASFARIKLYKNIAELERRAVRILYCDTDSIFIALGKTDKRSNKVEKIGDILWDLTKTKIADAVFSNIRSYSILWKNNQWETKISGTKRNSVTFNDFKKIFYSEMLSQIKVTTWRKNLITVNEWEEDNTISLKNYTKRNFSVDKKSSTPISVFHSIN